MKLNPKKKQKMTKAELAKAIERVEEEHKQDDRYADKI